MATIVNPNTSSAAVYDIPELDAGSDYALGVTIQNGSGVPVDLSSGTLISQIRQDWHLPVIATFTIVPLDLSVGSFNLVLYGTQSKNLVPTAKQSPLKYDVLYSIRDGGGNIISQTRLLQGNVNVSGAISYV